MIVRITLLFLLTGMLFACKKASDPYQKWDSYLGDNARTHYSSLNQITPQNVMDLQVAWTYYPGDDDGKSYSQCNPLILGDKLFAASSHFSVFAVDAATGKELWKFDPFEGTDQKDFARGLASWKDSNGQTRILFTAGKYLHALDAENGQLINSFGEGGKLDLTYGLGRNIDGLAYQYHAPVTVYKDLLIMGSLVGETLPAAPGHIRGFDAKTGEQKWIFHTIPQPGEFGYDTWEDTTAYRFIGGANNWTGMTLDESRGIVYVPTGSASYDFYGGNRKGSNLFANCLIALDANTGKRIWHYQAVHHDIWDRDFPSPPTLVTIQKDGKSIDAVAQISKAGNVWLFDRETGESLFPIEEKPYSKSNLEGEQTWETQPLPTLPPPFARQIMSEDELNPYSNYKEEMLARLQSYQYGGQFVPPSLEGTVIFPGLDGGGEWGGSGYDPTTGLLYVNANEVPWLIKMIKTADADVPLGQGIYQANCMNCHGLELQGSTFHGVVPPLVYLKDRMTKEQARERIQNGKGSMPSFSFLTEEQVAAVVGFLFGEESKSSPADSLMVKETLGQIKYQMVGYQRFEDKDGYPAVKPPWGTLNAINLSDGTIEWKVPLGEYEELTKKGIPKTGTENYGGPVITAGGLIFIGGTKDGYIRAFDKTNGDELWKAKLPAPGLATPATYEVNGKQYVVIAASGGKDTKEKGDAYIAFTLNP